MASEQRRHDLTDAAWAVIEPHTMVPSRVGRVDKSHKIAIYESILKLKQPKRRERVLSRVMRKYNSVTYEVG